MAKGGWLDGWSWSDIGHAGLDIAGFIPGVGEFADGANAAWLLTEGKYLDAAFSVISMVPVVGDIVGKGAKYLLKGSIEAMGKLVKVIDDMGGIGKLLDKMDGIAKTLGIDPDDLAKMKKALKEWYDGLVKKIKGEEPPAKSDASGADGVTVTKDGGKPYSNPKQRPKYGKGQVDNVWENAKQPDGNVYDPNTGELLEWDKTKSRAGQWDMGHVSGKEYRKLHKDYMDGKISKDEFLKEYRDPKNYQPESPSANRSRKYEDD